MYLEYEDEAFHLFMSIRKCSGASPCNYLLAGFVQESSSTSDFEEKWFLESKEAGIPLGIAKGRSESNFFSFGT